MAGPVRYKAVPYPRKVNAGLANIVQFQYAQTAIFSYLSSGPPSFLTMFRNENIVPKTSLASSSALRAFAGGMPLFASGIERLAGIHFFL